jgi:hypothetical protein
VSELTAKHLEVMFGQLQGCCLHTPVWTPVDVAEVLCSVQKTDGYGDWKDSAAFDGTYGSWKDGTDSSSYTVVRLKDGRLGLLSESEDFTGHGCQCSAATNAYGSLDDLLRLGVEEWQSDARDAIRDRLRSAPPDRHHEHGEGEQQGAGRRGQHEEDPS